MRWTNKRRARSRIGLGLILKDIPAANSGIYRLRTLLVCLWASRVSSDRIHHSHVIKRANNAEQKIHTQCGQACGCHLIVSLLKARRTSAVFCCNPTGNRLRYSYPSHQRLFPSETVRRCGDQLRVKKYDGVETNVRGKMITKCRPCSRFLQNPTRPAPNQFASLLAA